MEREFFSLQASHSPHLMNPYPRWQKVVFFSPGYKCIKFVTRLILKPLSCGKIELVINGSYCSFIVKGLISQVKKYIIT